MKGCRVQYRLGDGSESFMMVDAKIEAPESEIKKDIDRAFELVIRVDDPQAEITSYGFEKE